ncbi:MAG: DUF3422 domain-containing protein [Novosphingobium sp.]
MTEVPTMRTIEDLGLVSHPQRAALSNEMHVRKLPAIFAPARLMQILVLHGSSSVERDHELIAAFCGKSASDLTNLNYLSCQVQDVHLIWERHSEFSSFMFIKPGPFDRPFDLATFAMVPWGWFNGLGGEVVRATQLAFTDKMEKGRIAESFSEEDLVLCDVADGAGRLWSDFRLHNDGFGRLLLVDNGLTGQEAALVIQRLQELGNYRKMALFGLPVAQRLTPKVTDFEQQLSELTAAIACDDSDANSLLHDLSALSAAMAAVIAETQYRMSASRAYAKISSDRLTSLRVDRVPGFQTLGDFTDRRLLPAVRTCISFSDRLEDLSRRVAWTSALLRTRVDTALSRQNRDLLRSMNQRTQLQLRLQEAVEGLSVVAISYYLLSLSAYILRGIEHVLPVSHDVVLAALAPIILISVSYALHRFRRRVRSNEAQ